ncbi:muscarinic acetylcholine receptor M5-like isoform X2 [Portunus trituberculatus]|uniref:muscarinic acetylcholine receptor M5-like isoform X2 n=1 Tax=Portunus trituberculatus TaxID=210409 RepID=UPI001E1CC683|nr:muscarinic acetylcholine receptor M5-like isoform X2 [Portunus trituberculatus]
MANDKLYPYYRFVINVSDYQENIEELLHWSDEVLGHLSHSDPDPQSPASPPAPPPAPPVPQQPPFHHHPGANTSLLQEVTTSSLSLMYNLTSGIDLGLNWSSSTNPLVPSSNWTAGLDLDGLPLDLLNGSSTSGTDLALNGSLDALTDGYDVFNGTNLTAPIGDVTGVDTHIDRYSIYEVILIAVVAGFLSIATLIGNLMVMISFKIDKQLQTISNYFLFSLAVADITIGLVSMPLFTLYTLMGYWPLGPIICDTWLALDYLASNASVLNLLIISFDRYFSVTRPLTYRAMRTPRRAAVMIGSAWIISLILWPPWIYSWPYIEGHRTVPPRECYIQFIETNEYVTFGTAIAAFYLPVTVMCGLYWRIWRETEKRQKDLTNLQAGKKDPSKRSNSSEAEEAIETEDWRRQKSESSTAMDEIETTYVPTAMVIENTKYAANQGRTTGCCRGLASCIKRTVDREEVSSTAGGHRSGYHTPGYHTPGYHTPGYHTPGSAETTLPSSVSRCTSLNYIREPLAVTPTRYRQNSMIPLVERAERPDHHHPHHHHYQHPHHGTSATLPRAESTLGMGGRGQMMGGRLATRSHSSDSVYTILIRLPHDPSQDGPLHPPSIVMIEEEGAGGPGGGGGGGNGAGAGQDGGGANAGHKLRFERGTSPLARRGDSVCSDPSGQTTRVECSLHPGGPEGTSPVSNRRSSSHVPDIKIPLNAKIIPKQLAKTTGGGSGNSGGSAGVGGHNSGASTMPGKKKKKKKSQEKKQDRKAAKTLSAILLTFIVTWTPYNVLVLLKTVLACKADDCIPRQLWDFSYYLCYINSTINPMCYALCNAAFRRTYVRILTCKWHSRRRQGVQRGYYS